MTADETYIEAHIDFAAASARLAGLEPPRIALAEVLERLRAPILRKVQEGVALKDISAALGEAGIRISAHRLRGWIESGEVPARGGRRPPDGEHAPDTDAPSPLGPPAPRGFPQPASDPVDAPPGTKK